MKSKPVRGRPGSEWAEVTHIHHKSETRTNAATNLGANAGVSPVFGLLQKCVFTYLPSRSRLMHARFEYKLL